MKLVKSLVKFALSLTLYSVVFALVIGLAYFANEGHAKTRPTKGGGVKRVKVR